jgi:CelD/BcsL family acetyltransferase involved in cellulose biosynthesis
MSYLVKEDNLDNLDSYWRDTNQNLVWPCIFVLPPWLKAWWEVFGEGRQIYLRTVRKGGGVIGIAPLQVKGDIASFIGSTDVCDYLDFIIEPGHQVDFFNALFDDFSKNGVSRLELQHVRPDSFTMKDLVPAAKLCGCEVVTIAEEVNVEMDLPVTWDVYLDSLSAKQRHEVRRKLRRLFEAGKMEYRYVRDSAAIPGAMKTFFKMFVESRSDKAAFLTGQREMFFSAMAAKMAEVGLLRLGILELDGKAVAQIVCFDYNNNIYLYNSGYDPDYVSLSVGLISKALAIKDSIEKGRHGFDFLKGQEVYKYHLGGHEVPLYKCLVNLKNK